MTHTKGPWKLLRTPLNHDNFRDSIGTDKRIIAWTLRHYPGVPRTENSAEIDQANARLIAACPRMYDYIAKRAALCDNEAREILEVIGYAKSEEPPSRIGGFLG